MSRGSNRRTFLKTTAATGFGYWVAGGVAQAASRSALETINFASVGVGGKGTSDSASAGRNGNMVAICDIDERNLGKASGKWPKAKKYYDYRKMLEEMGDSIDAVTVSTPDHSHAPASLMAMGMGKHCFTQKPMTHTIEEARKMAQVAKDNKVQTQMGNQGTANRILRKSAALIRAGILGKVKEIHVWTNRPVWPQGSGRPKDTPAVPDHIHWDEFIGPAKYRPYHPVYHPFKWRGWWDFGTGALGDMACHTLNMSFMALDLKDPTSVQATTSGHNKETYPSWSEITYKFPALGDRAACTMYWYDGGKVPSGKLFPFRKKVGGRISNSGALIVGEKGSFYSPGDYGSDRNSGLWSGDEYTKIDSIKEPAVEFENSPGHFEEFARAIKTGKAGRSNFPEYAGPLTETVLLGNLAVYADGKKIDWDAKNLEAKNAPEVQHIVNKKYHNGYKI